MSKRVPCLGGCGRIIGTGCGCCSDDFPKEYGYCDDCFPSSDIYRDKLMLLRAIKDRSDETMIKLLTEFLIEFDHEFECIYINELKG